MIRKILSFIYFFIPPPLIWNLVRPLSEIVNFTAKVFQGIDMIWDKDTEFIALYKKIKSTIRLDKKRAYILYKFIKHCSSLEGEFAELGVYKGGGCKLISLINTTNKKIYGFDTFDGFPEMDKKKNPTWKKGQYDSSYHHVQKFINNENVILIKGLFPKTIIELPPNITFSFVHLDADLYEGTLSGLDFFYDKMVNGGIILIDDYGFLSCPGAKEAVDTFFQNKSEVPIYSPSGQCFIIKQ